MDTRYKGFQFVTLTHEKHHTSFVNIDYASQEYSPSCDYAFDLYAAGAPSCVNHVHLAATRDPKGYTSSKPRKAQASVQRSRADHKRSLQESGAVMCTLTSAPHSLRTEGACHKCIICCRGRAGFNA